MKRVKAKDQVHKKAETLKSEMLKSAPALPKLRHHTGKNGKQFIGIVPQWIDDLTWD